MRENLVFADQGGRGDLRHHEARIQARSRREEWRQTFAERGIHQSLDTPLADACKRTERNGQEIQSERQWFAVKVSSRNDVALRALRVGDEDEGIIDCRVGLDLE